MIDDVYYTVVADESSGERFKDWITLEEATQLAVVWAKELSYTRPDAPAICSVYRLNPKSNMSNHPILEYEYDARTKMGKWIIPLFTNDF